MIFRMARACVVPVPRNAQVFQLIGQRFVLPGAQQYAGDLVVAQDDEFFLIAAFDAFE